MYIHYLIYIFTLCFYIRTVKFVDNTNLELIKINEKLEMKIIL